MEGVTGWDDADWTNGVAGVAGRANPSDGLFRLVRPGFAGTARHSGGVAHGASPGQGSFAEAVFDGVDSLIQARFP